MAKMHNGDCPECGFRWRVREPAKADICPQCGFLVEGHRLHVEVERLREEVKRLREMLEWSEEADKAMARTKVQLETVAKRMQAKRED